MDKKEAVKIDKNLLQVLRNLHMEKGCSITWLLEKAVKNYLKSKKVDCSPIRTQNKAI